MNDNTKPGAPMLGGQQAGPPWPPEPWMDFGILHQFGFPYPGGLYLSFVAVGRDRNVISVEIPMTRGVVAGSVFRPVNSQEARDIVGQVQGDLQYSEIPNPKWAWLIPQLRYRIFIGGDLIKELLMMWCMGWEPSPEVQAALTQASREGAEEADRDRRVRQIIAQENKSRGGGGGGIVQ